MKRVNAVFFIMFFLMSVSNAQVFDDFGDGDFTTNPQWEGDLQDFVVNTEYQLQLDAADGGNSKLYIKYNTVDSMEWGLFLNLGFSPSNSNKLKIYLMVDNPVLDSASGYFLEIGENGNDDNLKFYELDKGKERLIAEGEEGLFANAFEVNLKVTKQSAGIWAVKIKNKNQFFKEDFVVFNDKFDFDTAYFLLDLYYTKTRKNKFVFDDIYIRPFEKDREAPQLISATLVDKTGVLLIFDEELDETSVDRTENYTVIPSDNQLSDITFDSNEPNKIILKYSEEFESGIRYVVKVKGLKDLKGNEISESRTAFFFVVESPGRGDLIINEILFNPNKGASDFIELVNVSDKFLTIDGVKILNIAKEGKEEVLHTDIVLEKGDMVCISPDTNSVINNYFVPDTSILIQNKLPGFDDDKGNVSLYISINNESVMIDSFDYDEEMHSSFVSDVEGLSLEKKNPGLSTNDRFNWTSCSTISGGATPGYKNSVYFVPGTDQSHKIVVKDKVFSPNNDGVDDELIIEYNLEKPENYASFYIFDSRGRLITQLVNNETLGKKGIIVWDGYSSSSRVPIGIYLLYYKIIDSDSNILEGKKTIVLADYLK